MLEQDPSDVPTADPRPAKLTRAPSLVLDEVTYPLNWEWFDTNDVVETIGTRPDHVNVVITGRDAPQALIDLADTVTEMGETKHAYQAGIAAKKGIDF